MSLYDDTVPQFIKMLGNLNTWLNEASAYAEERGFERDNLLQERLYPDMFPLVRQVQAACDGAKLAGARLADVQAPKHEDVETTFDQLFERIAACVTFLEGLDRDAVDAGAARKLFLPFLQGGFVTGDNYLHEFAFPNFYFHATTAYALLRHNGVKLGKRSFIGGMNVQAPPA